MAPNGVPRDRLKKFCPLNRSSIEIRTTSLGLLDRLPTEILHLVLEELDVQTAVNIRTINTMFKHQVESLLIYQRLIRRDGDALRALIGSCMARHTSLKKLHEALLSSCCEFCKNEGAFLNLLICKRVCHQCTSHNRRLKPITAAEAQEHYGLNAGARDSLPRFYPVYGYLKRKDRLKNYLQRQDPKTVDEELIHVLRRAGMDQTAVTRLERARARGTFFSTLRTLEQQQGDVERWKHLQGHSGMLQRLRYASNECALVDASEAEKVGIELHGSREKLSRVVASRRAKCAQRYEAASSLSYGKIPGGSKAMPKKPSFPPYTVIFDAGNTDPPRFAVVLEL
ncbi:MAG: hypothetical protein M1828_002461 [Chrysothrix sp. TS-e1954]|nr:MAG: hypothetical protein M1828_002461 [Chrysothrix sp. TS-e1954]